MTLTDKTFQYDPSAVLAENYPSWWITTSDFSARKFSHVVIMAEKTIVIDPAKFCGDRDWALAHIIVHMDDHADHLCALTVEDCWIADYVAHVRLDRECDRPMDCGNQGQMRMTFPPEDIEQDGDPTAPLGQ